MLSMTHMKRSGMVSLALGLSCPLAAGDPLNFESVVIATGLSGTDAVVAADFDGDGDIDAAANAPVDGVIYWLENTDPEAPTFVRTPVFTAALERPSKLFAVDIDRDGDTDLISTWSESDVVRLHENDGAADPSFSTRAIYTGTPNGTGPAADGLHVDDLNGDGAPDVIHVNRSTGTIYWHENDGMQPAAFTTRTIAASSTFPYEIVSTLDANEDGHRDLVATRRIDFDPDVGRVDVLLNDGAAIPQFASVVVIYFGPLRPYDLFVADVGDDREDVFVSFLGALLWFDRELTPSGPTFQDSTLFVSGMGTDPFESVFAADIEGDGDTDVLFTIGTERRMYLKENGFAQDPSPTPQPFSGGSISFEPSPPAAGWLWDIFGADVDADGDTDFFAADITSGEIILFKNDALDVAFNTRLASREDTLADAIAAAAASDRVIVQADAFNSEPNITLAEKPLVIDVAGSIDQLSGRFFRFDDTAQLGTILPERRVRLGSTEVIVGVGSSGDMTFNGEFDSGNGPFLSEMFTNRFRIGAGGYFLLQSFASIAVEHTGVAEIVGEIFAFNDSYLGFSGDVELPHPAATEFRSALIDVANAGDGRAIAAGDLDGDGLVDIATGFDGGIFWNRNESASPTLAGFGSSQTVSAVSAAAELLAEDVDDDNDTDLVAAPAFGGELVWFENESASFTQRSLTTVSGNARDIEAVDLDGDGVLDFVLVAEGSNELLWSRGDGAIDPAFTTSTLVSGPRFTRVDAAFVDGDAAVDLVSASFDENAVRWHRNDGGQSFDSVIVSDTIPRPIALLATDLDGDTDTDIIVGSQGDGAVRWFENDGAATPGFVMRTLAEGVSRPASIQADDFNGDGFTDVLVVDPGGVGVTSLFESDGASPPSFTRRTVFAGEFRAEAATIGDFDGAGGPDVATVSQGPGEVRWHQNAPLAPVRLSNGAELLAVGSLVNNRTLQFTEATITAFGSLFNNGLLAGRGTIKSGVTNDGEFEISGDTTIEGDLVNNGATTISPGVLTVQGALTNNGSIAGTIVTLGAATHDSSRSLGGIDVNGPLTNGRDATLRFIAGQLIVVKGDFRTEIDDHTRFDLSTASLQFTGVSPDDRDFEVLSRDIGPTPFGLDPGVAGAFPIGTLRIGPDTQNINLIDAIDNAPGAGREALYVDTLILEGGSRVFMSDIKIYFRGLTNISGAIDMPSNLLQIPPQSLGPADIAPPIGIADQGDANAFLQQLNAFSPSADLVEPVGVWDFNDVAYFLDALDQLTGP